MKPFDFDLSVGDAPAWDEWLGPLLTSAMAAAPLDLADTWALALRFGLTGLGEAGGESSATGVGHLLRAAAAPTAEGGEPTDSSGTVSLCNLSVMGSGG